MVVILGRTIYVMSVKRYITYSYAHLASLLHYKLKNRTGLNLALLKIKSLLIAIR